MKVFISLSILLLAVSTQALDSHSMNFAMNRLKSSPGHPIYPAIASFEITNDGIKEVPYSHVLYTDPMREVSFDSAPYYSSPEDLVFVELQSTITGSAVHVSASGAGQGNSASLPPASNTPTSSQESSESSASPPLNCSCKFVPASQAAATSSSSATTTDSATNSATQPSSSNTHNDSSNGYNSNNNNSNTGNVNINSNTDISSSQDVASSAAGNDNSNSGAASTVSAQSTTAADSSVSSSDVPDPAILTQLAAHSLAQDLNRAQGGSVPVYTIPTPQFSIDQSDGRVIDARAAYSVARERQDESLLKRIQDQHRNSQND